MYVLSKNKKNFTVFHLKINILTVVKNRRILHRRVIVMLTLMQSINVDQSMLRKRLVANRFAIANAVNHVMTKHVSGVSNQVRHKPG